MFLLTSIRRHPAMRKLGKRLERGAKTWLYRALTQHARAGRPATPETLLGARRILLVRPNFRIGNAVIGARLIQALRQQPEIELDYLGTDTTRALFVGMPLAHYGARRRECRALGRPRAVSFGYRPRRVRRRWYCRPGSGAVHC